MREFVCSFVERRISQTELGVDNEDRVESALGLVVDHVCDLKISFDFLLGDGDHFGSDVCADDSHLCVREHLCDGDSGAATNV